MSGAPPILGAYVRTIVFAMSPQRAGPPPPAAAAELLGYALERLKAPRSAKTRATTRLALLLIRLAERKTGQSWRRIATELQRLHLVTLQGAAGTVQQTTRLTDAQCAILAALDIEAPPRITALEPA